MPRVRVLADPMTNGVCAGRLDMSNDDDDKEEEEEEEEEEEIHEITGSMKTGRSCDLWYTD